MNIDVTMPQMGESVAEGTIIKWMVKPGESVEQDDPLFEISTDKVDAEVPSPASGVLSEILVPEGETVEVGALVAVISAAGSAPAPSAAEAPDAVPAAAAPVAPPAAPPEAAPPADPAAPPAAPAAPPAAPAAPPAAPAAPPPAAAVSAASEKVRSSPVARRLARENNIDLSAVPGTGRGGRVSKGDVLAIVEGGAQIPAAQASPASPGQAAPASAPVAPEGFLDPGGRGIGIQPELTYGEEAETIVHPMTNMRRLVAEHMVASRRTSAHVGSVFEVDFSRVYQIRRKWKGDFQARHGANLSVTTFVLHALAPALRAWPIVNASVVDEVNIEYHRHVNLGVAVALSDGLIVPVIRNLEQKGLGAIARELADLGERARTKKLLPDEVAGSTFTLTNPGIFGASFGMPVINQPNVAILGMGGIQKRVVATEEDAIAIRPIAIFCMSFDHRIIDGAVADQFLADVKEKIENFPEEVLA